LIHQGSKLYGLFDATNIVMNSENVALQKHFTWF